MEHLDYWKECIETGAEECGATLTKEQIICMAEIAMLAHENIGMAFYSPPVGDREKEIRRECEEKYNILSKEFEEYKDSSQIAVKRALKQRPDANVHIGKHGEVFRSDGRTEQIL